MKLSKKDKVLLIAYEKGYRVINGEVISPSGQILKPYLSYTKGEYKRLEFKVEKMNVAVHRLAAYQKYGKELFRDGIEVRHKDGNSLNNSDDNILIGTKSENALDKLPKVRKRAAIQASNKIRRFSDDEMKEIKKKYNEVRSYKKVMREFGISSKGTLHYILNNKYQTNKL